MRDSHLRDALPLGETGTFDSPNFPGQKGILASTPRTANIIERWIQAESGTGYEVITLVAYDVSTKSWYVVPAHEVVRLVSSKRRGQHTENPFESATLSLRNLMAFRVEDPDDLRDSVLAAVSASEQYTELRKEMQLVLTGSRRLADECLERVRALLSES